MYSCVGHTYEVQPYCHTPSVEPVENPGNMILLRNYFLYLSDSLRCVEDRDVAASNT